MKFFSSSLDPFRCCLRGLVRTASNTFILSLSISPPPLEAGWSSKSGSPTKVTLLCSPLQTSPHLRQYISLKPQTIKTMLNPTTTSTTAPPRPRLSLMMPLKPSSSSTSSSLDSACLSPRRPRLTLSISTTPSSTSSSSTFTASSSPQSSILSPSSTSTAFDAAVTGSSSKRAKVVKRVSFREEAEVKCVSPLPRECYGDRGAVMLARWRAEVQEGWE